MILIEFFAVKVILCGDPSHVSMSGVLARKYPHSVEIFVDEFQTLSIVYFVANRFNIRSLRHG